MDLALSDEQRALKDSAERFLKDRYPFDLRRRIDAGAEGYSGAMWQAFAELGWLALPFAAADGGLNGSMVDATLLMETFGAALVAEPYISNIIICGCLLGMAEEWEQRAALLGEIIAGRLILAFAHDEPGNRHEFGKVATRAVQTGSGWRLHGQKRNVLDAPLARRVLVSARMGDVPAAPLGLFLLSADAPGVALSTYPVIDGRRAANIVLDNVSAIRVGRPQDQAPAIEAALNRAVVAFAADAIGAMQVLLDRTIAHTKTRIQFGQPLAANQVLKHRMVDMAVRIEEARSITLKAAIHADDTGTPARLGAAASAAKVKVAAASRYVAEQAVQLHGAMGVTDELDIGAYFKRLMAFEISYGTPDWHQKRYGTLRQAALKAS